MTRKGTTRTTESARITAAQEANRRRGHENQALKLAEAGWLVLPPEELTPAEQRRAAEQRAELLTRKERRIVAALEARKVVIDR